MNSKVFLALKEASKIDSMDETIEDMKLITQAYVKIIQSIYDSKPELKEGEVFIETLSIKIFLTTRSILELINGINVSITDNHDKIKLLDFPSINILTRSIIEAFLTLEYLFYNELEETEKLFRLHIYRFSGYKARQDFFEKRQNLAKHVTEKLDTEIEEMENLLNKIESSVYYKDLKQQHLWKLDKFGLPRLKSWAELLDKSTLKTNIFSTSYKLYSNYAHSEFISLIQMNSVGALNKDSNDNNLAVMNSLKTIKMINCVSIILLKDKFECTSKAFENLEDELKEIIKFWKEFATE
ncbi:MAG: DUF5677 domain-containing protein [Flavobacterium sp.]|uniref:DUF5677 domain-containing protein n=1 Tax=Flavobacterium sp. TaxID=239 RepID=UPI0025BE7D64|nr:DUF5677 domain-containing protein [Flavobacterium sp.]MCK6608954.1 DUF5677 domain-containing protein [Flavobacterium sp.]